MAISDILTAVTTFIGIAFGWIGNVVDVIEAQPVLFIFVVAVPLVGLGVGLFKRLVNAG